ncbi:hypothetical protein [Ammoniphilus sp. YIM 78166]|uniref:hypothetical protein n=1 Tax=Ammoniphilus sp. YIM 78166 TaxID=1644106 RepID=UPI00107043CA|nr:hypothetical protein [Ammoniphilus sp. YIM 78166]
MSTKTSLRLNQEQIEKMVLDFIKSSEPGFKIEDAVLETSYAGEKNEIQSWWVACEHKDGNESIMEDEQILMLIQQQQGWGQIKEHSIVDSEQEGFILQLKGE